MLTIKSIEFKLFSLNDNKIGIEKYYCLKSIDNFLYHFKEIRDEHTESYVLEHINEYLNEVEISPIYEIADGKYFYDKYIRPVGKIYEKKCNFMPYADNKTMLYIISVMTLIMYSMDVSYIWYSIIATCFVIYYIYVMQKKKKKKVYGLFW